MWVCHNFSAAKSLVTGSKSRIITEQPTYKLPAIYNIYYLFFFQLEYDILLPGDCYSYETLSCFKCFEVTHFMDGLDL